MIRVDNVFFARRGIIDREQNTLSIIDIIEEIGFKTFPAGFMDTALIAIFLREKESDKKTFDITFNIKHLNNLIGTTTLQINLTEENRNRTIMNIPAIKFPEPGLLEFEIICNNKILTTHKIEVKVNPAIP